MSKRPYFPFYAADWLSAPEIALMTPAQEGGYIRLCAYCWKDDDCSLPDDLNELAKLARLTKRLKPYLQNVVNCFISHPLKCHSLTHPRLWEIYVEWQQYREMAAEKGRKGAAKRWGTPFSGNAQTMPGDSLSPSPSQVTQPRDPCTQDSVVTPAQEARELETRRATPKDPYPHYPHTQVCFECGHHWTLYPGKNGSTPFYGHGAQGGPMGCRATCAAPVYQEQSEAAQARKDAASRPKPRPLCPQCNKREPKAGDCLCATCLAEARQ